MPKRTEYSKYNKYFPRELPKKIKDYATNVALNNSRYIVIERNSCYCTSCHTEFDIKMLHECYFNSNFGNVKHNGLAFCPHCKKRATVKKAHWFSRYQYDHAKFIYFEKARSGADAIIAYGVYCFRDYRQGYKNIRTRLDVKRKYYFEVGKAKMFEKAYYYNCYYPLDSVTFATFDSLKYIADKFSLIESVESTSFKYMKDWITGYEERLLTFSQKPIIEILYKTGFENIVDDIHHGYKNYRSLNWKAKNICKFLKLPKEDFNILREKQIDCSDLKLIQVLNSKKVKWKDLNFDYIKSIFDDNFDDAIYLLSKKEVKFSRLVSYYEYNHLDDYADDYGGYHRGYGFFSDWKDYVDDCIYLGLDISNSKTLCPKDLHEEHEKILKQIQVHDDEVKSKKMKKRAEDLQDYVFEFDNYIIRPPYSVQELIRESDKLGHCVKQYTDRYIACETNLMFLRKKNQPNVPFYTLEFRNEKIIQCRTKKNISYRNDEAITKVVDEFVKTKLNIKKKRKVS